MARLSDIQKIGLFQALTGVDLGGNQFQSSGNPEVPEQVAPVGVTELDRDTGAPGSLLGELQNSKGVLIIGSMLALLGIFAVARKVI